MPRVSHQMESLLITIISEAWTRNGMAENCCAEATAKRSRVRKPYVGPNLAVDGVDA